MAEGLSLDDLQDEVFRKLQLLDGTQLGQVCVELSITLAEKTRVNHVLNVCISRVVHDNFWLIGTSKIIPFLKKPL